MASELKEEKVWHYYVPAIVLMIIALVNFYWIALSLEGAQIYTLIIAVIMWWGGSKLSDKGDQIRKKKKQILEQKRNKKLFSKR